MSLVNSRRNKYVQEATEERRVVRSLSSYHFPLGTEKGVALERLVLVGGDEGEDAVVSRVRRAVRDPEKKHEIRL